MSDTVGGMQQLALGCCRCDLCVCVQLAAGHSPPQTCPRLTTTRVGSSSESTLDRPPRSAPVAACFGAAGGAAIAESPIIDHSRVCCPCCTMVKLVIRFV